MLATYNFGSVYTCTMYQPDLTVDTSMVLCSSCVVAATVVRSN